MQSRMRIFDSPGLRAPQVKIFSNGRYQVVITNAGSGYSRWRDLALTRWREDVASDCWGTFIYLRDPATNEFWSAGYQPALRTAERYEVIFTPGSAEFRQHRADLEIQTQICVSPEDDVELRRVTFTNHFRERRVIELTSYAEVVLTVPGADLAHPVFSNLFVQTEFLERNSTILCRRRARSENEPVAWLFHSMVGEQGAEDAISCETDRVRFVGRGRTPVRPVAMENSSPLSNTTGSVLDPIVSLRRRFRLSPDDPVRVDFVLGVADTRDSSLALSEKYRSTDVIDRVFDLARGRVELSDSGVGDEELQMYERLASALIYADPARRASPEILLQNRRGQSGLWRYGISGDLPIVLVTITAPSKIERVRQLSRAHRYWRLKGLLVDLVILTGEVSASHQPLYDQVLNWIASGTGAEMIDKPAGIFVRRMAQIPDKDRVLLQSVACIVQTDENEILSEQFDILDSSEPEIPALTPTESLIADTCVMPGPPELAFYNGLGGFTSDGDEYVVTLRSEQVTPAPWVNVVANPFFGTVISESGSAYTWAENSHEFRLTPWYNDPVTDACGEAFYIRDEQSGHFWSPTPFPLRGGEPYIIRHGFGYSVFEHAEGGIVSELVVYVALDAPVKIAVLKLRNVSQLARKVSVTGYCEWVLGDTRQRNMLHVQTEVDVETGALLARNFYNADFSESVAFADVDDRTRTLTGDRNEFLGRNGTLCNPAALKRAHLSGKVGAGLDPCGAIQVTCDLPAGSEREIGFRLGAARSLEEARELIGRFRGAGVCREALETVRVYWKKTLQTVQVETPDKSVNLMANGWLLYQTLSCRLWGRTGFYQSGGAFGFRDQLQDVMALVHAEPALTREHLVRAAARQFREGDVQHWWHPPVGRGVRTHASDDYLWLPYVTCRYVSSVGDSSVLDENIPFLEGRPLNREQESDYDLPARSAESGTLYEHCVRAIQNGLKFGIHGLPLMGSCDWNDGMNLVGKEGRGESVWLAFFLYDVLTRFAELASSHGDKAFAERCLAQAHVLQANIEQQGWDGQWYRRAYFDNGEPLGSHLNSECQIDSIPQSWSVISGAGDPKRARQAMQAVGERLVRFDAGLIQLLDPPFDRSDLHPGYIKGYVPGVRENGGQYTHAAVWTTMAYALLGDYERAWELAGLLNPISHGDTASRISKYKVEPYVIAADVYSIAPHTGRGGWTWYTGSAGWMYRLLTETLLGLNVEGDKLRLMPRLPRRWSSCKIHYRYRQTFYHITISKLPEGSPGSGQIFLDGRECAEETVPLVDDRRDHTVEYKFSREAAL
jgi:cyclic beta-1,2-glucan synthetase